jgi:cell wall assembly regulator SMI1
LRWPQQAGPLAEALDESGDDLIYLIGIWWDPQWVLFGQGISGSGVAIDQRSGPGQGMVGEFLLQSGTEFIAGAGLGEYVAELADCLEYGVAIVRTFQDGSTSHDRPHVENGGLAW